MKWGIANMTWEVHRAVPGTYDAFFMPTGLLGEFRGRDGAKFVLWAPIAEELLQDLDAGEPGVAEVCQQLLEWIWKDFRHQLDRRYDVRMTWTLPLAKTW